MPKTYFEAVNSWGKEYGDDGFCYIPAEYIEKGFSANPITLKDLPNDTYVKLLSRIVNLYKKIIEILSKK